MADEQKVNQGDVGVVVTLDTLLNITTGTVFKIKVQRPDKTRVEWVAGIEGLTKIAYTLQAGDVAQPGTYKLQAYVVMPGFAGHGTMVEMYVSPLLE